VPQQALRMVLAVAVQYDNRRPSRSSCGGVCVLSAVAPATEGVTRTPQLDRNLFKTGRRTSAFVRFLLSSCSFLPREQAVSGGGVTNPPERFGALHEVSLLTPRPRYFRHRTNPSCLDGGIPFAASTPPVVARPLSSRQRTSRVGMSTSYLLPRPYRLCVGQQPAGTHGFCKACEDGAYAAWGRPGGHRYR
jgi:hypothetical protein